MDLINPSSLIIQTINISIVIFVLWKYFFKPYLAYLDIEAQKRRELEENSRESEHIISQARIDANKIIDEARIDARSQATEIIDIARKESDSLRTQAAQEAEIARKKWFADLELERKKLTEELKSKVLGVALKMNEKLFSNSDAQKDFLKKSHNDINL